MVVSHYPYLLLKMPTIKGVLSIKGDLKKAYYCDIQAIQISERNQDIQEARQITTLAAEMNPQHTEIPTKKPGKSFTTPTEVKTIKIDLQNGDPEKTAIIRAELDPK